MNELRQGIDKGHVAIVAAATLILGAVAFGQTGAPGRAAELALQATPPAQPEHLDTTLVYVNGSGSVRVPPDMASVVVGVDVERPTLAEAQAEASTQATAIIDAIKAAGVAEEDLRTASFNVRVVRERDRERGDEESARGGDNAQRDDIRGFQVSNAIAVTVRDLDTLGRILDDAIAAGANEVRNVSFSLTDPDDAAEPARTRAMDDARTKAEGLASAAGMTVSRVVSISETYSPRPEAVVFATANAGGAIADASGGDVPIAIGTDEIAVEVQVTYELK
ncbi:MAG: SIMPL domain-containing protein [Thermomicrobiales bacterium]